MKKTTGLLLAATLLAAVFASCSRKISKGEPSPTNLVSNYRNVIYTYTLGDVMYPEMYTHVIISFFRADNDGNLMEKSFPHTKDTVKKFKRPNGDIRTFGNVRWFSNLPVSKRNEEMILTSTYNEFDYPKYDNFDVIEVSKVKNIPKDYDGIMGVPITFLNNYNPEQFKIIWLDGTDTSKWYGRGPLLEGKVKYRRIFIQRKK